MSPVPEIRVTRCNDLPVRPAGEFVLYWMISSRRTRWNFGLQHAVEWANRLGKPLLLFEPLRVGYPWASDRLHRFILDGMADNLEMTRKNGVPYYPYVEPEPDADKGLLAALSEKACLVVTDAFPAFFLPRMVASGSRRIRVSMEQVDSNGMLPMRAAEKVFTAAKFFRSFLQRELPAHLAAAPDANPLRKLRNKGSVDLGNILKRWPGAPSGLLEGDAGPLSRLPVDHRVGVVSARGGSREGARRAKRFVSDRLSRYEERRNHPDEDGTSGLSPYIHFGHCSVHEIFHFIAANEEWSPDRLGKKALGGRSGWWRMSPSAEAFLDQLVTWRELGFNMCSQREDYDEFHSLPGWARQTLEGHAADRRRYCYRVEEFEKAQTHDPLWNASQRQLLAEGRIHNYLRMVWGKKILEWTASPQEALDVMIELNNKYGLDGRDPNSSSGIFWVLGRYDRAWGPERAVVGKVRYMSSENTLRKLRVSKYLEKYTQ